MVREHSMLYLGLILCGLLSTSVGFVRVCYYAGWASTRTDSQAMDIEQIDPHVCTHVLYSFGMVDATGTFIQSFEGKDIAQYQRLVQIKRKNPNLKILLAIGGWNEGSVHFSNAVSSESKMRAFASNAASFLRGLGFDGLDIDWEYPAARGSPPEDKARFARWLQLIHEAFQESDSGKKLILSVAVSPTMFRVQTSYNVTMLSQYTDMINLMMYDFHGAWEDTVNVHSALYSDNEDIYLDHMARQWAALGAPKDKLVMGMPLYGKRYTLADPNNTDIGAPHTHADTLPYYEICRLVQQHNITEHMLATERVPYFVYHGKWYTYDNVQSLQEKAEYVRDNGFGGVMVWSIDMDDALGGCHKGPYPLMHALMRGLSSGSSVVG